MRRITVVHRHYWDPNSMSPRPSYQVMTLKNLTDNKLDEWLSSHNNGYKTSIWTVKEDFHLDKKSEQCAYMKYCIDCFYEPYCYDTDSLEYGAKMVESIRNEYDYFKQKSTNVWTEERT